MDTRPHCALTACYLAPKYKYTNTNTFKYKYKYIELHRLRGRALTRHYNGDPLTKDQEIGGGLPPGSRENQKIQRCQICLSLGGNTANRKIENLKSAKCATVKRCKSGQNLKFKPSQYISQWKVFKVEAGKIRKFKIPRVDLG